MMQAATDMTGNLEAWLIYSTFHGTVFCGLIATVYYVFRRWIPATLLGLLWLAVVIRMVIPEAPTTQASLFHWFDLIKSQQEVTTDNTDFMSGHSSDESNIETGVIIGPHKWSHSSENGSHLVTDRSLRGTRLIRWSRLAMFVWGVGALVYCGIHLRSWIVCQRLIQRASPITDPAMLRSLARCKRLLKVSRPVAMAWSSDVQSPSVTGLVLPLILWPASHQATDRRAIRMLLCHELAHLKRNDIAIRWLVTLAGMAQWFNPLYWYARRKVNEYQEIACDRAVLSRLNDGQRKHYGHLMIDIAANARHSPNVVNPLTPALGVEFGRRNGVLLRRLTMIRRQQSRFSIAHGLLGATVLVATLMVGFTDSRAVSQETTKASSLEATARTLPNWFVFSTYPALAADDGPKQKLVKVYAVSKVVEKLSKQEGLSETDQLRFFPIELAAWSGLLMTGGQYADDDSVESETRLALHRGPGRPAPDSALQASTLQASTLQASTLQASAGPIDEQKSAPRPESRFKASGEWTALPPGHTESDAKPLPPITGTPIGKRGPATTPSPEDSTKIEDLPMVDDARISMMDKGMVVSATAEQHRRIEKTLAFWSRFGRKQITYEIQQIECSPETYRWISKNRGALTSTLNKHQNTTTQLVPTDDTEDSVRASRVTSEPLGIDVFNFDRDQMERLKKVIRKDRKSRIVAAPKVTTLGGRSATVASGVQRPFMTGFAYDKEQNSTRSELTIVNEGTSFSLDTDVLGEKEFKVSFHFEMTRIDSVKTREVIPPDGKSINLQVPVTTRTEVAAQVMCDDASTLVISGLKNQDGPDAKYVIVTVATRLIGPAK